MNQIQIKKMLSWSALPIVYFTLGFSMPSCPGQQAMQQQIDSLQNSNTELMKKLQHTNQQITTMTGDMTQVKQILPQVTTLMTTIKAQIEQLEKKVQEIEAKHATKGASHAHKHAAKRK